MTSLHATSPITLTLARFACQLTPEAIPAVWRRKILLHLLDALGCGVAGLENAIGLAASLTPLPGLHKYNWQQRPLVALKDYNAPATEAGVRGVLLHREGIIGPRDVLAGEQGFWRMAGSDQCDASLLVDGLGDVWRLRHASIKRYPVCRWMHTALAAFEQLLSQQALSPERITQVRVIGSRTLVAQFADTQVLSETDAQFSVPQALACLAYGIPRQNWSDAATRQSATLLAFSRQVELVVDNELERLMAVQRRPVSRVRVNVDGQWLSAPTVDYPPGCEENPMADAEIVRKCRDNLSRRLRDSESERLIDALLSLERQPDAGALLAPLFAG
ncbi:MmgE/PrpD family protein [Dickeya zeae]|nr:MmgE/PrpD family protein [Dickeya zeae]UPT55846.1 MmgE/PrpD family protein [Dickeya zeae]